MAQSLPSHARAVVIGGGVIGCSVAYHMTAAGWSDVLLLERSELSGGTTWASSALITHFSGSPLNARLHIETIELYRRLEAETGQSVGFHRAGSIRLAEHPDRVTEYRRYRALANYLGVPSEIIGPNKIRDLHPLLSTEGVLAAAWTPEDGYVDPSSATQALAQAARAGGAKIVRQVPVRDLRRAPGGEWQVTTDAGTVTTEVVVNAAGMWAPEIGKMVGVYHPVVAFERQYFVTEDIERLAQLPVEPPVLRDPEGTFYARKEIGGLLVGPYEREPKFWGLDGVPHGFSHESLDSFLDEAVEPIEAAMSRLPIINEVGIRAVVNVPTSRTPDTNPLVGPVAGVPDYWVAAGFFGGVSESSVCKYLSHWIVDGDPGIDLTGLDPRRFGADYTQCEALDRIRPQHIIGLTQAIGYPDAEPAGGRPARTSPIYDALKARGAIFGVRAGWETPLWFAPEGVEPRDAPTFGRASWFPHVAAECRAVRTEAGILDRPHLTKIEVSGRGAPKFLDRLSANYLPADDGDIALSPMLAPRGTLEALPLLTRLEADRYCLTAEPGTQGPLVDWLERNMQRDDGVWIEDVTTDRTVLLIAGPVSTAILAGLTDADLSLGAFPTMTSKDLDVGFARIRTLRHSTIGETAWELHAPVEYQYHLYDTLMAAGRAIGLVDIGLRTLESLRLEAGYRGWGMGITQSSEPREVGLDRHLALEKGDFVGREGLAKSARRQPERRLVSLAVDTENADPFGAEPVFDGDTAVALTVCGGYGHTVETALALAYLPVELTIPGTALDVEILGDRRPATVVETSLHGSVEPAWTDAGNKEKSPWPVPFQATPGW